MFVHGPPGTGKRSVLRAALRRSGCQFAELLLQQCTSGRKMVSLILRQFGASLTDPPARQQAPKASRRCGCFVRQLLFSTGMRGRGACCQLQGGRRRKNRDEGPNDAAQEEAEAEIDAEVAAEGAPAAAEGGQEALQGQQQQQPEVFEDLTEGALGDFRCGEILGPDGRAAAVQLTPTYRGPAASSCPPCSRPGEGPATSCCTMPISYPRVPSRTLSCASSTSLGGEVLME